ncbi:trypsin-1-like [Venturia canescens]|uniref:trypsin-1-like n=1 Tax=Venturia canescens TaxID=32260 RepID=UPI001C9C4082|nr:trypsin-1-like [Venturia canescens]
MRLLLLVTIFFGSYTVAFANSGPTWYLGFRPRFPNGRIVGGEDAQIEDHPWQASLEVYGFAYCGASIISNEWVLTAGHCTSYPASSTTVRAGTCFKNRGGSTHQATLTIRHENYGSTSKGIPYNDIALIKVATPFVWDATRAPIELFNHREEAVDGTLTIITGWGAVHEGGSSSEMLQVVKVPIISKKTCNDAYMGYGGLPEGQICAAHPQGGYDACQGDSGGPLTIGRRLAGIVSWGNGCARPGYPGVYTEVASYRQWIADKADV